ncbi:hypothetical protein ACFQ3L_10165 [Lacticaseibacillus jixianensis]|uniref:Uncharacterized protein n=1 Tax=Lacticaseibacillus jixianensis TaxID=2486012 RepID=A0ABW4BC71_9LACO|nr:hypothetical protein [Lacticaseibacillus jixianensis]
MDQGFRHRIMKRKKIIKSVIQFGITLLLGIAIGVLAVHFWPQSTKIPSEGIVVVGPTRAKTLRYSGPDGSATFPNPSRSLCVIVRHRDFIAAYRLVDNRQQ